MLNISVNNSFFLFQYKIVKFYLLDFYHHRLLRHLNCYHRYYQVVLTLISSKLNE